MKSFLACVSAMAAVVILACPAAAWQHNHCGPWAQTAAFPPANPPGWYTNTYSYAWHYPWYAYYHYGHGPYANWVAGGGNASYVAFAGAHPAYPNWMTFPPPAPAPASANGK